MSALAAVQVDKVSYEILQQNHPGLLRYIRRLVERGQTPKQIADHIASRGATVFLAALCECAAGYIKENPEA